MRELERRYPDALAVVGVHSGKYVAERDTARIREASLRLGTEHPVVNDRHFRLWRAYAVRAWPTLAVVDARGHVVGQHAGEFEADELASALDRLVADAARGASDGAPRAAPLAHAPEPPAHRPGVLRYPGKVALDPAPRSGQAHDRLAVADTGHHRVVVGRLEGDGRRLRVTHVAGDGRPGLTDGALAAARFGAPQGMAFAGDTLYVADAGSHAVRAVRLDADTVRTLAGTGRRVRTREDRWAGAMASPWDVAMLDGTLYVAMAGTHQLWALDPRTGQARVHAGRGGEDLEDDLLERALLAQPMGLAAHDGRLWFADAETSAVRWADAGRGEGDGRVGTLVGTGLFDFGDRDGVGDDARLQHAQGVAVHPRSGRLLVVDSYNDALKWLDPATRAVTTWVRGLHEPGGAAVGDGVVYVADTNAHRVVAVDELSGAVAPLEIVGLDAPAA